MTKKEKKNEIERLTERFMNMDENTKTMAAMVMSAYMEGKTAGKAEERRAWEQKQVIAG